MVTSNIRYLFLTQRNQHYNGVTAMNWRDILLGSIVTLFVTVVGSVIAYYFTREPAPPPPAEKLIYEIDAPVSFDSGETKMSFFNVRH